MEQIIMTGDNGEEIKLYILETTKLGGVDYILASDAETGDGECYIFKDVSEPGSKEAVYEPVESDLELDNLVGIFAELLEDADIQY